VHKYGLSNNFALYAMLAMLLGVASGGIPWFHREISFLTLMGAMCLSMMSFVPTQVDWHGYKKHLIMAVLLNYGLLSSVILLLSFIMVDDVLIRNGFVMIALVPPIISGVPFTQTLGGDVKFSILGTSLMYALALLIAPFGVLLVLGHQIHMWALIEPLLLLIIIPFITSRCLLKVQKTRPGVFKHSRFMTHAFLFVLIFVIMGANRRAFFADPSILYPILVIGVVKTALVGTLVYFIAKSVKLKKELIPCYMLFASMKNSALAVLLAISLFPEEAGIPGSIMVLIELSTVAYYSRILK